MADSNQQEKCFFKEIYSCGSGKLIQYSRIDAILMASEICQDEILLRPKLSEGSATVRCHNNYVTGGIIGMTEGPQTIATWVYSTDATMPLTGNLKKMSLDDAHVQTTHKENSVCRINRDEHDRQSLHAGLVWRIDPMDSEIHATECLVNMMILQLTLKASCNLCSKHETSICW